MNLIPVNAGVGKPQISAPCLKLLEISMSAIREDIPSATISSVRIDPYPASEKIYVQGSREDIRVPMRKITLSDTPVSIGVEKKMLFSM